MAEQVYLFSSLLIQKPSLEHSAPSGQGQLVLHLPSMLMLLQYKLPGCAIAPQINATNNSKKKNFIFFFFFFFCNIEYIGFNISFFF